MATLEYWTRIVRLTFVIVLATAGYLGLITLATGWQHAFLIWMFWPFIIATMILEILQIYAALLKAKQHKT